MKMTFILLICLTLGSSDQSAKPVRLEIEETSKGRRKRYKGQSFVGSVFREGFYVIF